MEWLDLAEFLVRQSSSSYDDDKGDRTMQKAGRAFAYVSFSLLAIFSLQLEVSLVSISSNKQCMASSGSSLDVAMVGCGRSI